MVSTRMRRWISPRSRLAAERYQSPPDSAAPDVQWRYYLPRLVNRPQKLTVPRGDVGPLPLPEGDFTSCACGERPEPSYRSVPHRPPLQQPCVHLSMSVACVWSVCAPVWLILATPSRRSISPLNGPTPDATPLWDDVILRGLVRPAPRTDPRRNTPCGGDVILRGPCRSDSSRASPSEPSQTSHVP